jgi:hypothetical protein
MERKEIIDILNGMCERCLIKGLIQSLDDARKLYDVFDRFRNNGYVRDDEYSDDILYFYNLATKLHKSGNTSLEESYSIYNAILAADNIDFIETDVNADVEYISEEKIVKVEPVVIEKDVDVEQVKVKRSKSSRSKKVKTEDVGVIDISDISL